MKKEMMQNTGVVWLLAMVCCLLWGSAFPCVKIGYELFRIDASDTASQIVFAGTRFFLAGVLTLIFGSISQKRLLIPKKTDIPMIGKLALFQTILQYLFFYIGLAHTTGVKSYILCYEAGCVPLLLYMALISAVAYSLWAVLLKYNPVSRVTVFGFMNPVFGVILSALLLHENGQAFTLRGVTSLILVCIGIYIVNRSGSEAQEM